MEVEEVGESLGVWRRVSEKERRGRRGGRTSEKVGETQRFVKVVWRERARVGVSIVGWLRRVWRRDLHSY